MILFLATALAVSFGVAAQGCDTLQLPYSSDFTQCWTTGGGATIINSQWAELSGAGQTLTSPWFVVNANDDLYVNLNVWRDTNAPINMWEEIAGDVQYSVWIRAQDGTMRSWMNQVYAPYNSAGYSYNMGNQLAGQAMQIVISYENGTAPIYPRIELFQYTIDLTVDAPATASVGDTVTVSSHIHLSGTDMVDYRSFNLYSSQWNYINLDDTSVVSVVSYNDSNMVMVCHMPGALHVEAYAGVNITGGYYAYKYADQTVYILDTVQVDCDSLSLPYIADFTQCWTTENGATLLNPIQASITSQGQKITGPWLESEPGMGFVYLSFRRDDENWGGNSESIRISVESPSGVVAFYDVSAGYWSDTYPFNSPGGPVRVSVEYTGSTPVPSFTVNDIAIVNYQVDIVPEAPSTASVGDTTTITFHPTLPNGDVADYDAYLSCYDVNGNWVEDGDPRMTVIAATDTSRTVVWHARGQFRFEFNLYKTGILSGSSIYARFYSSATVNVADTVQVDCDNIGLPYTADFTQCWTGVNGAMIGNDGHATLGVSGRRIVGPLVNALPGQTYVQWQTSRDDQPNWTDDERYQVSIVSEDGVLLTGFVDYASSNYNRYHFDNPGGRFRVVVEQIGSAYMPSFQVFDLSIYQYEIDLGLEFPKVAKVGDTVTIALNATLQNDDIPDLVDIYMWDQPNYNQYHVLLPPDADDPTVTLISQTDHTVSLVWNTAGRFEIGAVVGKRFFSDGNQYYADANIYGYIKIVDNSLYAEDSIYYTSAAKDSVIGCHSALHRAVLPESVEVICDSAFFYLQNLSYVSLPSGLRHIGKMAFAISNGFSEITIPENVTYVGDNAFWSCLGLNTVNFNATNCQTMAPTTESDGSFWPVFIRSVNIHTINIGDNVTRIPDRAFSYCEGLRGTLVIPDAVTYIGTSAFYHYNEGNTDSLAIVIGSNVSTIGNWAFYTHDHVSSITSRSVVPPVIESSTFLVFDHSRLFVPCGSRDDYMADQYWLEFDTYGSGIFENCEGIEENSDDGLLVISHYGSIFVYGAEGTSVAVYDAVGRMVAAEPCASVQTSVTVPQSGVYVVRIGDRPARRVVVIR